MEKSIEKLDEVRVKNEPICDSQSIPESKISKKVKEEPIDNDIETSKSHIESKSEEVEIKAEEKFSATEEFANKISIAYLNEEISTTISEDNPTSNQQTTSNNETNNRRNKKSK